MGVFVFCVCSNNGVFVQIMRVFVSVFAQAFATTQAIAWISVFVANGVFASVFAQAMGHLLVMESFFTQ